MKKNRVILNIVLCSLLLLTSCNSDVFIDELKASSTELQMNGNGDSTTVTINSGEYYITSIDQPKNPTASQFYGKIYDENGNKISEYDVPFFQYGMLKGKMVYSGPSNGFTVSRLKDESIDIHLDENLNDSAFKFTIWVSNHYKAIPINITQSPADGYVFDHITYTYIPGTYWTDFQWIKDSVDNKGDTPIVVKWSIFSGIRQIFAFSSNDKKAFSYLRKNQYVEVPICLEDSVVKLSSEMKYYKSGEQRGNLPFNDVEKTITLPVGMSEIRKIYECEHFSASYTLYVRNVKTNEIKSVSGKFHSYMPTGKNYYLLLKGKIQK